MNLEPTGERMVLEHYGSSIEDYVINVMHIATYKFAEQFARGKRVLDYGCGSGYGSARISEVADFVHAVDVSGDAIKYAQNHYQRPNLSFLRVDPDSPLPFPDQSFDTVLSFQVFEHILKTEVYLSEIRRILVPGGRLVLVTPDRKTRLLPLQQPWNRWHIHEYSASEIECLLGNYFQDVQIQHMSGRKDVIDIEIRRCTKLKWMTLPFTLPFIPRSMRIGMLNLMHRIKGNRRSNKPPKQFDFDDSDITIAQDASPSINLVVLAENH